MNDLPDLLARWADVAPDECRVNAHHTFPAHVWTAKDASGDADSNLWMHGDGLDTWAAVIAGVTYHAARRGLCLGMETGPFDSGWSADARAWPPERHADRALPYVSEPVGAGDGLSALRALATATLRAYLSALTTP